MTPLLETLANTVMPSDEPLEVAEVTAIPVVASAPSPKLDGGLKEWRLYKLVGVRFVECDRAHWGPVQALVSESPTMPSTSPSVQPMQRLSVRNDNFASLHGLEEKSGKAFE
jgi:hypothetical protein